MTAKTETAILAGGCFWGVQDLLRRYPGVLTTRVGYSGGDVPNATYRNHGTHAEAIEITEIRRAVEGLVAARAAERITDAEIAQVRALGAGMTAAPLGA